MATVTCTPASPRATVSFCRIDVDAATQNDDAAYDADLYPASPEIRYYLSIEEDAVEKGRSYVFSVNEDGKHVFPNYVFPDSGTYVVHLRKVSDDSSVADTGNITVQ
jgi:hypothetical protein